MRFWFARLWRKLNIRKIRKAHPYLSKWRNGETEDFPYPFGFVPKTTFDYRETYALNSTMIAWIYEHLNAFLDKAENIVDLEYHTFEYLGDTITLYDCIKDMIFDCEILMRDDIFNENWVALAEAAKDDLFARFALIYWQLWW